MRNKKAEIDLPFSWLFAIIVGAVIIFIAIYAVSQFMGSQQYAINTATAKELSIVFDSMETGAAAIKKPGAVKFSDEIRIYNKCYLGEIFGFQKFSLSSKGFGNKWSEPGGEIKVVNKYVFSDEIEQGKEFFFFAKPFDFPFKVSEIIFISKKKYCFVDAPNFIKDEIDWLNSNGVENVYTSEECIPGDFEVCFGYENCDIKVAGNCKNYGCENDFDYGSVSKNGKTAYYSGSLIYGAIFSDYNIYECNVKRLMKRFSQLAYLYYDEAIFLQSKGCGSEIATDLVLAANMAKDIDSSVELINLYSQTRILYEKNNIRECSLW